MSWHQWWKHDVYMANVLRNTCPPGIKLFMIDSTRGFCTTLLLWYFFLKCGSGHWKHKRCSDDNVNQRRGGDANQWWNLCYVFLNQFLILTEVSVNNIFSSSFSIRRILTKMVTSIKGPGYVETSCLKDTVAFAKMKCLQ